MYLSLNAGYLLQTYWRFWNYRSVIQTTNYWYGLMNEMKHRSRPRCRCKIFCSNISFPSFNRISCLDNTLDFKSIYTTRKHAVNKNFVYIPVIFGYVEQFVDIFGVILLADKLHYFYWIFPANINFVLNAKACAVILAVSLSSWL